MIYKKLNWNNFSRLIDNIEKQIKHDKKEYNWVISVNRGGLIAGVELSHRLNAKHGVFSVQSYSGTEKKKLIKDLYISMIGEFKSTDKILVVDDIADSGESLQVVVNQIKKIDPDTRNNIDTATLHYNNKSVIKPNYYASEVNGKIWIVYPWEKKVENNENSLR